MVIILISNGDESAYRAEVQNLASWGSENNLFLNIAKTKELIINFRRSQDDEYAPVFINGARVERVSSFRFLGTHISDDLMWSSNTMALVKKAQQLRFFPEDAEKRRATPTDAGDFLPLHHR